MGALEHHRGLHCGPPGLGCRRGESSELARNHCLSGHADLGQWPVICSHDDEIVATEIRMNVFAARMGC